jgi:predicted PurR-regulated permease PerM
VTDKSQRRVERPAVQLLVGVVLLLLAWALRDVALLCFGAVIVAAFLRSLAEPLARRSGLTPRIAILVVVIAITALLAASVWIMGQPLLDQLLELRNTVPKAWETAREWAARQPLGQRAMDWASTALDLKVPFARVAGVASAATTVVADFLLVLLLGIYLALDPKLYLEGTLQLVPPDRRRFVGSALTAGGEALQRWLLGQGVTMLIVGTTIGVGLALLGMPLAAALGFISGLLEFVPFFGAIASALLGILLAFAQGPTQALYVGIFFLVVQQLEGNVIIPLVQRWAAHLPPVLSLLAVVVFGSLFGVEGIVLGTPLMVVLIVLVRKLHIERQREASRPAAERVTAERSA